MWSHLFCCVNYRSQNKLFLYLSQLPSVFKSKRWFSFRHRYNGFCHACDMLDNTYLGIRLILFTICLFFKNQIIPSRITVSFFRKIVANFYGSWNEFWHIDKSRRVWCHFPFKLIWGGVQSCLSPRLCWRQNQSLSLMVQIFDNVKNTRSHFILFPWICVPYTNGETDCIFPDTVCK